MDIATIVGTIAGFGVIFLSILQGGSAGAFINIPSIIVVLGGTICATLINFPLGKMIGIANILKNAFVATTSVDPNVIIETLVGYATTARKEGMLALEDAVDSAPDQFLKTGLQLAVDGTQPEVIRQILETELNYINERHQQGASMFKTMSDFAPAFGLIGTLIGLIQMLKTMEDPSSIGPSMAVALITTFYGAVLANLIFTPLSGKLKGKGAEEVLVKEIIIEGILSIQNGENPRVLRDKLNIFLPPSQRKAG